MIHLDTSVLIDALAGPRTLLPVLRAVIAGGDRLTMCSLVSYEWLRGPRTPIELRVQEELCPPSGIAAFGAEEASFAARLYSSVPRPRGREIDLAIAACAIVHGAALWTQNGEDFEGLPGLSLFRPPRV